MSTTDTEPAARPGQEPVDRDPEIQLRDGERGPGGLPTPEHRHGDVLSGAPVSAPRAAALRDHRSFGEDGGVEEPLRDEAVRVVPQVRIVGSGRTKVDHGLEGV